MIIIGGANGAGKTTFVRQYIEENKDVIYLSADAIAEELAPGNIDSVKIKAGRIFIERMAELIKSKKEFLVETTLSGLSLLRDIDKTHNLGLKVELIYLFHDSVEVCINRVNERVLAGGHNVPMYDIIRRYKRSLNNFWYKYKNVIDEWHLLYNSHTGVELCCKGWFNNEVEIIDPILFELFKKVLKNEK